MSIDRLSLNQVTIQGASLADSIAAVTAAGMPGIGLWRSSLAEVGAETAAAMVRDAGLRASALCFSGHLTMAEGARRRAAIDDNRRAIEEAAIVGAPAVVWVPGGLEDGSRDLAGAFELARDGLGEIEADAVAAGVTIAIEPMHPMYLAQFSVVVTLGQALDLAEQFSPAVGVMVDTFHTWWDPELLPAIARAGAGGRIAGFQADDFLTPLAANPVNSRGHLGDGHIDFAPVTRAVADAGYRGDVEVEIFNEQVWAADHVETAKRVARDFERLIAPHL